MMAGDYDTFHNKPSRPPSRLQQYFASLSASFGALAAGIVIGYGSPATYQLHIGAVSNTNYSIANSFNRPDDEEHFSYLELSSTNATAKYGNYFNNHMTLSTVERAWFSSSFSLGALIGSLISCPMLLYLGRRRTMILSVVPSLIGWLLIGLGKNFEMLVVGRIFTGVLSGIVGVSVNTYIGEIASSDIRGVLGSSFQVMYALGEVYAYVFGAFIVWYQLAFICFLPSALFSFLMYFHEESPVHLVMKGRDEEAKRVLQYFRGQHYDISEELSAMKQAQAEAAENPVTLTEVRQPYIYKPLLIVIAVMIFKQLAGINVLVSNIASIFKSSGTKLSVHLSSVSCVAVEVVASVLAGMMVETAGRKRLLVTSAVGMAVSHACLGLFFAMQQKDRIWTTENLPWLPLCALMFFMVMYSVGFGAICWILVGEMFSANVKETAGGLAIGVQWIASFIVVFSFEPLQLVLTKAGFYFLTSGYCVLAAVFCAICVQETKGKTLDEITAMFGGRQPRKSSPKSLPQEIFPQKVRSSEVIPTERQSPELLPEEVRSSKHVPTERQSPELLPDELRSSKLVPTERLSPELLPEELRFSKLIPTERQSPELVPEELRSSELVPTERLSTDPSVSKAATAGSPISGTSTS